jgi:hypothetical protein
MIKSASEFLALSALKRGKIEVRGQDVHFREIAAGERGMVVGAFNKDPAEAGVLIVALCVTDPDGKPLFSKEQASEVAKGAPDVVDCIAKAIMSLSGMEDDPKNA